MATLNVEASNGYTINVPYLVAPLPVLDSGSAAWTPVELSDLFAWYNAADTNTTSIIHSGGLVSAWLDQSGNGFDLVQDTGSLQPETLITNLNGLNVLNFDGADRIVTTFGVTNSLPITHVGVYKWNRTGNRIAYDGIDANERNSLFISIPGGTNYIMDGGIELHSGVLSDLTPVIVSATFDGTNSSLGINGDLSPVIGNSGSDQLSGLTMGSRYDGIVPIDGYVAEHIIFLNATSNTIQKAEGHMAHLWGITLPTNHPYYATAPLVEE